MNEQVKGTAVVGIDLRCLPMDGSEGAGIAHASRFLAGELVRRDVPWRWRAYVPNGASVEAGRAEVVPLADQTGSVLRRVLGERPCDLLLVPSGAVAWNIPVPAIPWIHDVAIYEHPEWFPESRLRRMVTTRLVRRGVSRAPFVLAVSENSRQGIARQFTYPLERIVVTHEGGDPFLAGIDLGSLQDEKRAACARLAQRGEGIPDPFILVLGTVEPRKNIPCLVRAWQEAKEDLGESLGLVVAGKSGWGDVHIPEQPNLRRLADVDDRLRRDLLLGAAIVAVPSWHEGFGVVALEAMEAGTPVLASRRGAHPEVVGDGGILLDPSDYKAWTRAIVRLMNDAEARTALSERGKRRSTFFSWQITAEKIVEAVRLRVPGVWITPS